ncbi:hypothetical protein [Flavobacterium sp. RS13.1]|uniref:hypothetical protein n=1 Tax=Flavobacterium sp. RS13.1 TaxID=3400345 RepID=UPI003AADDCE3
MCKNLLLFICLLFICCSINVFKESKNHNFKEDIDRILWSSKRKLVWDDFRGIPDTSRTNIGALTSSKIEITENDVLNGIPKYVVQCYFVKSKSWTTVSDASSLLHEQLHFDIDELFTRKIRKAFDSLNIKKVKDYQIYDNVYIFYGEKCEAYQKLYDNQVYFNDNQQEKWMKKVGAELLRLKKYEYIPEE